MTLSIRSVTPKDISALMEIERQSFAHPHWDSASFLRYNCLIAEIDQAVAGFLVSRETSPGNGEALPEREILNVAVAAEYRRLGIATALLKRELRRRAVHFLEVRESNVAAQTLYRKLGFVQVGSRPKYYEFPSEKAIVMKMK